VYRLSHHPRVRFEILAAIEDCYYAGDCTIDDKTGGANCSRLIAGWPPLIGDQGVGPLQAPNFRNLFELDYVKHQVFLEIESRGRMPATPSGRVVCAAMSKPRAKGLTC
jgi:hypothetical protein